MNKKGFTLIELLAVIIILAIIALILTPIVTKIINTSKLNSLKVSAYGILEAGENQYGVITIDKNLNQNVIYECFSNECSSTSDSFKYNGSLDNAILVITPTGKQGVCLNKDNYYALKEIDEEEVKVGVGNCDYDNDELSFLVNSNSSYKNTINELVSSGAFFWDFNYTNSEQEFIIPFDGIYQIEVWGAQGGSQTGVVESNGNSSKVVGGYGGYATGKIKLTKDQKLYINVGGQGGDVVSRSNGLGGYNGGGNGGKPYTSQFVGSGGGGGATHISLSSGLLSSLSDKQDDILIVAGGGGGASWTNTPTSGGGFTAKEIVDTHRNATILGGSQTSGYAFGKGGDGATGRSGDGNAEGTGGGGGGYYGGYAYKDTSSGTYINISGTGGSGYIGNPNLFDKEMYCYNCITSDAKESKTILTTSIDNVARSKYAKKGNGYVRITLVKFTSSAIDYNQLYKDIFNNHTLSWEFDFTSNEVLYNVPINAIYQVEVWGAQGGSQTGVVEINGYSSKIVGGYGGYATGKIKLTKNQNLYINVGGQGGDVVSRSNGLGGYNGGGNGGMPYTSSYVGSGGGGGATHISFSSGLLSSLSDKQDDILIVAGGGGGASWTNTPTSGGGFAAKEIVDTHRNATILGGSQTSGYAFGKGGDGVSGRSGEGNAEGTGGGGGGYYGGYAYKDTSSGTYINISGTGGSGYIGNPNLFDKEMYCYNCITSDDKESKTILTTSIDNVARSKYAKKGNGYVKITLYSLK